MDYRSYLMQHIPYDLPILEEIDRFHRGRFDLQPFIEPEIGRFLALLVRMNRMKRVLELGTGIGYSAIWIASGLITTKGELTTVDHHERTGREAEEFFSRSSVGSCINRRQGDILDVLSLLARQSPMSMDMVFQDGGKQLYPRAVDDICTLLKPGGILVTDDVLFPVEQDVRTGLKDPVDRFNCMIREDRRFYSAMLPVGHGVMISWKQEHRGKD